MTIEGVKYKVTVNRTKNVKLEPAVFTNGGSDGAGGVGGGGHCGGENYSDLKS